MAVAQTDVEITLENYRFRAKVGDSYATFWRYPSKGGGVNYMVSPNDVDDLIEMLQAIKARWRK